MDICPLVSTSLKHTVVEFLSKKYEKIKLSKIVSDTRNPKNGKLHAQTKGHIHKVHQKNCSKMECWISGKKSSAQDFYKAKKSSKKDGKAFEIEKNTSESDSSDSHFAEKKSSEPFLIIQIVEDFLTKSNAFHRLSQNLRVFILPRSFSQLASSIPPD